MKIIYLIISFIIISRVSLYAYPVDFPKDNCLDYFKKNDIQSAYPKGADYNNYYSNLKRSKCYKDWTVLVFMAADNDLTPYAYWDIYEMENIIPGQTNLGATTDTTDVIVELDTFEKNGINRYHIFQNDNLYDINVDLDTFTQFTFANITSPVIKSYQEQNKTVKDQSIRLERFLQQSIKQYPSKHYMLVIWGHGEGYIGSNFRSKLEKSPLVKNTLNSGKYLNADSMEIGTLNDQYQKSRPSFPYNKVFGGVAFDYTDVSFLDIPSIKQTINNVMSTLQYDRPIDILAFDACLMQSLEVASELSEAADYILGSTQIQNYLGLPYKMIFDFINQGATPFELGKKIPELVDQAMDRDGYQGQLNIINEGTYTASTLSSHNLKNFFIPALMEFSSSVMDYIQEDLFRVIDLKIILENSPSFMGETRDIGIFLAAVEQLLYSEKENGKETLISINLKNKILVLWNRLNEVMLNNQFGTYYTNVNHSPKEQYFLNYFKGISIWLPSNETLFKHRIEEFRKSTLYHSGNQKTPWETLLDMLYNSSTNQ